MFIKGASISNFRLFKDRFVLNEEHLNIPDGSTPGSGLTILVGENGLGKSTILEAIAIPLLEFKAENVSLGDMNDFAIDLQIEVHAHEPFKVKKSISGDFEAVGFVFESKIRERGNSKYLSSPTTSDTKYIQNTGQNINQNSADLRVSVNNPFSGPRYSEVDCLFIDKNRTKQLESGLFSSSRFDRLLGDFNYQYLTQNTEQLKHPDSAVAIEIAASAVYNDHLKTAFNEFKRITNIEVEFSFIDDSSPYTKAYLTYEYQGRMQLPIEKMGSGYQMLLSILSQYYLSQQSGKRLIILIDEIELHLHHRIQKALAGLLTEFSKTAQIIITTHSGELLKDIGNVPNSKYKTNVLCKNSVGVVEINPTGERVLPSTTIAETNYIAFAAPSMEYFNELYGHLVYICEEQNLGRVDDLLCDGTGIDLKTWTKTDGRTEDITIHTCLRHKIHHPENELNDSFVKMSEQLPASIETLREKIKELTV